MNNANDHNGARGRCRIAITGGIGSGKSYICRMLESRGISIFYCDLVAKDIIAHDADVRARLARLVGGEPTRQRLGDYLRAGNGNDARVNAIVHPRVAEAFDASGQQWMECAILFESGFDSLVDNIVVVTCPTDERIRRIIRRDHCDADTARRWMALQLTDEERLKRAQASADPAKVSAKSADAPLPPAQASADPAKASTKSADAPSKAPAASCRRRVFRIVNDGTTPIEPQLDELLSQL